MVAQGETHSSSFSKAVWCCFYAAGIIGMLVVYGLLQERVMTVPYGGEAFTHSVFLVFCNRLAAVLFAFAMALLHGESLALGAPMWKILVVSLSNVVATSCQYEALKYVSFAVQMLGKSFKMLPVMIWGIVISQKQYVAQDWIAAILVTGGVTEFLLTGPTDSATAQGNSIKGLGLLLVFLGMDGLTSTMQEKVFKEHRMSKYNQMAYVNLCSCAVSLVTLMLSRALVPSVQFCCHHSGFVLDAFLLSLSAVGGQFFIYSQVRDFGALAFAATMNVRQLVSILVSYATYHHFISWGQIIGLCLVFGALFYKSYQGLVSSEDRGEKRPLLQLDPKGAAEAILNVNAPANVKV